QIRTRMSFLPGPVLSQAHEVRPAAHTGCKARGSLRGHAPSVPSARDPGGKMMRALTAGLLASSLLSFAASADTLATKDMPARIELHPFQTLTLSDQQFLTGDKAGAKPTTLGG